MAAWLFKTEPSDYSYADLVRDGRVAWEGVANATALIHLRKVAKGDFVVVYHTGSEKRAVGLAAAASDPYPDPKLGDAKRVVVDLAPGKALPEPVPLAAFRADAVLATTDLVRLSRLSIVPLSDAHLARLLALAKA